MYKKELKKMHARVRLYNQKCTEFYNKLVLIERVDWVKSELGRIGGNHKYYHVTVRDKRKQDELEELFGIPFEEIESTYRKMLDDRNAICHKYTMRGGTDWYFPGTQHLQNDAAKRDAYSQAIWSDDVEKNKINLSKTSTTTGTQTDASTGPSTTTTPIGPASPNGVFSTASSASSPTNNLTTPDSTQRNLMADFDDVGNEADSLSDIDENVGDVDEENEETARARLQKLYQQNPDLVALQVSPIKKSDGKMYTTIFLGPESRLHNSGSGKKSNVSENNVDWKVTLNYVVERFGLLGIRDRAIRNKDPRAKRRVFDALVANTQMNKELETKALDSIANMYQNVPNKMKYLEDNLGVYPLDKTKKIHTEFGLRYDPTTDQMRIINRETGHDYIPFYKVVNWVNTLEYILARAEAIGLDLNRVDPTKRTALGSPQTTPSDARRQLKVHRTEGVSVANKPITNIKIYQEIEFILARSPFLEFNSNRLHPFASGKFNKTYYFGSAPDIDTEDNSTRGGLELYNGRSDNPIKTNNNLWQTIDWDRTLVEAINILKRIRSRAKEGDVVRQINETLQLIGASPLDGSEDQDFVYNPRPTRASTPRECRI